MRLGRFASFLLAAAGLVLVSGCGVSLDGPRNAVPEPLVTSANVYGYSHVRFWGDDAGFHAAWYSVKRSPFMCAQRCRRNR